MNYFKLRPLTLKRLKRFRSIKRGYYSFIILVVLIFLSFFSELFANSRALVVKYEGDYFFPTYRFIPAHTFGQVGTAEVNYRKLEKQFESQGGDNFVIMPLIPFNPFEYDFSEATRPPDAPSARHWLVTDDRGRDVLVRLIYGFRLSILFAVILAFASQAVGAAIGCAMGYFGGWVDLLGQRLVEIWANVPFLYLVIIVASIFEPNFWLLLAIMVVFNWIALTYYMRTEVYREKSKDYCTAARAVGAGHSAIIFKHLLPNSMVPLITLFPFQVVTGISSLTMLDFLGYGLPAPTPSWGELMKQSLEHLDSYWLSFSPFVALTITLFLVTFIGEAVREAFDPKEFSSYT